MAGIPTFGRLMMECSLMGSWLLVVLVAVFMAWRKSRVNPNFNILFWSCTFVFLGDTAHQLGSFAMYYSQTMEGVIGGIPLRPLTLLFDLLVFSIFYQNWAVFAKRRYPGLVDRHFVLKWIVRVGCWAYFLGCVPLVADLTHLTTHAVTNWSSPHQIAFMITATCATRLLYLGAHQTWENLMLAENLAPAQTIRRDEERTIMRITMALYVSQACFAACMVGLNYAPRWGMMMIPKTIAYMVAFVMMCNGLLRNRSLDAPKSQ